MFFAIESIHFESGMINTEIAVKLVEGGLLPIDESQSRYKLYCRYSIRFQIYFNIETLLLIEDTWH